ncbi:hypothetical protein J8273_1308 [Carpediemonas membranifera]|uniref:Uncharacterized protein n=1 Tax=Carpediemonas membranifera TaxID=201153 RepID=A0A8J6AX07_9EUKA|nr:hypothetical protein J8273_1308 [Carpediemonas membranifera]|eukprot:KAG9396961.1 hypothetical protein J8273_1308 [Carpediemonas membranifera]
MRHFSLVYLVVLSVFVSFSLSIDCATNGIEGAWTVSSYDRSTDTRLVTFNVNRACEFVIHDWYTTSIRLYIKHTDPEWDTAPVDISSRIKFVDRSGFPDAGSLTLDLPNYTTEKLYLCVGLGPDSDELFGCSSDTFVLGDPTYFNYANLLIPILWFTIMLLGPCVCCCVIFAKVTCIFAIAVIFIRLCCGSASSTRKARLGQYNYGLMDGIPKSYPAPSYVVPQAQAQVPAPPSMYTQVPSYVYQSV